MSQTRAAPLLGLRCPMRAGRLGLVFAAGAAVLIATAGCSSGEAVDAPSVSTGAPAPAPLVDVAPVDVGPAPRDPVTEASAPGTAFGELTGLRMAREADTDHIVFEFADEVPGYDIRYLPRSELTGSPVPAGGAMALVVTLSPASGQSYGGPVRLPVGISETETGVVEELRRTVDDGSRVVWAVFVRERVPFTVDHTESHLSIHLSHED